MNLRCSSYDGIFLCDIFARGSLSFNNSNKNLLSESLTILKEIEDNFFTMPNSKLIND